MNDIFVITSVIDTGNLPWSYFPQRSLFSPEERVVQTVKTIESIRKYAQEGSKILLVEASNHPSAISVLKDKCDYFLDLSRDEETRKNCLESNCKGLGDSWLFFKGIEFLKNTIVPIFEASWRNIYKLSARYQMNEKYNVNNISNDLPTFKHHENDIYITFFFSVPFKKIDLLNDALLKTSEIMKHDSFICLEVILPSFFNEKHVIDEPTKIGAQGVIAVDTRFNVYSV